MTEQPSKPSQTSDDPVTPPRIFDYVNNQDESVPSGKVGYLPPQGVITPPVSVCKSQNTPRHVNPDGLLMSSHTKDTVHPYVREDIKDSKVKALYEWLDVLLDLPKQTVLRWASQIGQNDWFNDPIIAKSLCEYCEAKQENERYAPWCALLNRILELAPGQLDGVPADDPWPIDDLCFVNHSEKEVGRTTEHGLRGARRLPDIAAMRAAAAKALDDPKGKTAWSDFLFWHELKYHINLTDALNKEIAEREAQSSLAMIPEDSASHTPVAVRSVPITISTSH